MEFTSHLTRHVRVEPFEAKGRTLRAVLREVFERYPAAQDYIVDEQGRIRKHVAIFVDDELVPSLSEKDQPLTSESTVFIMQALSGG